MKTLVVIVGHYKVVYSQAAQPCMQAIWLRPPLRFGLRQTPDAFVGRLLCFRKQILLNPPSNLGDALHMLPPLRQPKSYRPHLLLRILWAVFFGALIGLAMSSFFLNYFNFLVGNPDIQVSDLARPLGALIGLVFFYGFGTNSCVTLSERGIVYSELGYSLSCTWRDIKHAAKVWTNLGFNYDLVVWQSNLRSTKWLGQVIRTLRLDKRIPISRLMYDWRYSELGEYIRYYAPHIDLHIE